MLQGMNSTGMWRLQAQDGLLSPSNLRHYRGSRESWHPSGSGQFIYSPYSIPSSRAGLLAFPTLCGSFLPQPIMQLQYNLKNEDYEDSEEAKSDVFSCSDRWLENYF